MAEAAGVGVVLEPADAATLFGEDQARYLIACSFDKAEALMVEAGKAGVTLASVGKFTGSSVKIGSSEAELDALSALYTSSFAANFDA